MGLWLHQPLGEVQGQQGTCCLETLPLRLPWRLRPHQLASQAIQDKINYFNDWFLLSRAAIKVVELRRENFSA